MIIRDYEEKDAGDICHINTKCYEYPEPDDELIRSTRNGKAWVAVDESDGFVFGFIIGTVKHGIPYIHNIAVLPGFRGKGTGKKLIEKFEGFYHNPASHIVFWLQVCNDNPAQKLYFDLGYRVESVDENFYGRDKHALCMHKYF